MDRMKALVKEGPSVRLREVPRPEPGPGEVLVRVAVAGLCRTDLFAARGLLRCADPVVLGHEFSGTVAAARSPVPGWAPGDRVAVMPAIPCGACERCSNGSGSCCPRPSMLGVDRDGAFAEFVAVPARVVHPLPAEVPFREGAYAEPMAASLAVLKTGICPGERGLIYGGNRIAQLTERVLRAHGFAEVAVHDPASAAALPRDAYDFIIETRPTPEAFDEMLRAVRPGGRIILKSRPHGPVGIDLAAAVRKEVTFQAAAYGAFGEAVALLARRGIDLSDLLGTVHPLEDFERVFEEAFESERSKSFFSLLPEDVWHR